VKGCERPSHGLQVGFVIIITAIILLAVFEAETCDDSRSIERIAAAVDPGFKTGDRTADEGDDIFSESSLALTPFCSSRLLVIHVR
jgi:hypothetical protein